MYIFETKILPNFIPYKMWQAGCLPSERGMGGVLPLIKIQSQVENSCSISCFLGLNEIASAKVISKNGNSTQNQNLLYNQLFYFNVIGTVPNVV